MASTAYGMLISVILGAPSYLFLFSVYPSSSSSHSIFIPGNEGISGNDLRYLLSLLNGVSEIFFTPNTKRREMERSKVISLDEIERFNSLTSLHD